MAHITDTVSQEPWTNMITLNVYAKERTASVHEIELNDPLLEMEL